MSLDETYMPIETNAMAVNHLNQLLKNVPIAWSHSHRLGVNPTDDVGLMPVVHILRQILTPDDRQSDYRLPSLSLPTCKVKYLFVIARDLNSEFYDSLIYLSRTAGKHKCIISFWTSSVSLTSPHCLCKWSPQELPVVEIACEKHEMFIFV